MWSNAVIFNILFLQINRLLCSTPNFIVNAEPPAKPFIFGVATAAYQIEGGFDEDGRGLSIWDEFSHRQPSPIADKSTGDVACDSYHQMERDILLLQSLGVHAYRFSISWSRVLPTGDPTQVDDAGIKYYNHLIDRLIDAKITPFVTIFHWDTPLSLEEKFGGFTNPLIADYFEDYAHLLFEKFGDRVKNWITFNEPTEFCGSGYGGIAVAPAVNLPGIGNYLCMHNLLISHAKAYKMYQAEFKEDQQGEIGITLNNRFPFLNEDSSNTEDDLIERFMAFTLGWQMDPLFAHPFHGYPESMKRQVESNSKAEGRSRSRLPKFSAEDQSLFQGKIVDFMALNYYTSRIVSPGRYSPNSPASYDKDMNLTMSVSSSWIRAKSTWLYSVPDGLHRLLLWIKNRYGNPKVIITENGWSDEGEMHDIDRIKYLKDHLEAVKKAIADGVDVQGYFHWSLMDNFEWDRGFTEKFGLYSINFTDPARSYRPKDSVQVYKDFIANGLDFIP